ncbi:hypothetical protein [Microbacterium sp.]|uniref:hypothetical protein n=1 Tax=Microbacterium sp. TaxID=51671 RepID=UPI003C7531CC
MNPHSEQPDDPTWARDREGVLTLRRIPASVSEVTRSLVLLERPAAVTDNDIARITQIGAYAAPSAPGGPFRIECGRISVRIDTDAVAGAFLADPDPRAERGGALPALQLRGRGVHPVHRCHALDDADRLVLEGLTRVEAEPAGAPDVRLSRAPARAEGELPDQLERVDDLITHTPRSGVFIPHRHIEPGVLFGLLEHACNVGLPIGIAVLSSAVLHAVQDVIETVSRTGGLTVVTTQDAIVEVALYAVRHCILVRLHGAHGPTSVLELYDAELSCIALISQFGIVGDRTHDAWEHLADSLPDAI